MESRLQPVRRFSLLLPNSVLSPQSSLLFPKPPPPPSSAQSTPYDLHPFQSSNAYQTLRAPMNRASSVPLAQRQRRAPPHQTHPSPPLPLPPPIAALCPPPTPAIVPPAAAPPERKRTTPP